MAFPAPYQGDFKKQYVSHIIFSSGVVYMFRVLVTLVVSLLAVYVVGCGTDEGEIDEDGTVGFRHVNPPGGTISANAKITLTFDGEPRDVKSTAGNVTILGKTVVIEGPFIPGDLNFTVTWMGGSVTLKFDVAGLGHHGDKSLDAIEVDDVEPRVGVPVNFLRSEPKAGFSIIGVETIRLYFDNRPSDVKITQASEDITQAIVKSNTVEVSLKQPVFMPDIYFTVTWTGGKKRLIYPNSPDDVAGDVIRVEPADGSSIVGVKNVQVFLDWGDPRNVKCYDHTSESFIEDVTVFTNMIKFPVPHPIEEDSIRFTVSWTSRDGTVENSRELRYTNEEVD